MRSTPLGWVANVRKSRPSGRPLAKAGFSLIEVLATLLVTMLLVLTLTPFVSQMLRTWARGGEVANLVELKTRGLGRLREDLRHALVGESLHKIGLWTARHGLGVAHWPAAPFDPFFNVNTPEEAARAEQIAAQYPDA